MGTTTRIRTSDAFSGFAVRDVDQARAFYADVLGVDTHDEMGGFSLQLGPRRLFVYGKPDHEPAVYTILNFPTEDIEAAVDDLTSSGVTFEQYDGPMGTDAKGISHGVDKGMGPNIAWFRDPSGNILSVIED